MGRPVRVVRCSGVGMLVGLGILLGGEWVVLVVGFGLDSLEVYWNFSFVKVMNHRSSRHGVICGQTSWVFNAYM